MKQHILHFIESDSAVTAIEYALASSLIVVVIIVSVGFAGSQVGALYTLIKDQVVLAISK
jgi:Flp pilus assembly pilin Flp